MRRGGESVELLFILTALVSCLGCKSTPPPQAPAPQEAADLQPEPQPEPSRQWVEFYSGKVSRTRLTDHEKALWDRVADRTGTSCDHDPRLILAAREHAYDIVHSPNGPTDADLDRLRFSLTRLGNIDYAFESQIIRMDRVDQELLGKLGKGLKSGWTHCGVGVAGPNDAAVGVWIGVHRTVDCDPAPVVVRAGASLVLHCRALNRSKVLLPYLGLPDGSVQRLRPVAALINGKFGFSIPLGGPGRYEIELLVQTPAGPRVAALFPIFAGVDPDPLPVVTPDVEPADAAETPDQALLTFVNTARTRAGLGPLERDFRLDRAAVSHSHEMAKLGFFGHVSPSMGTLEARMESERLNPRRVAENMARSRTPIRIHRNLMASPSHRINILDSRFTHVGIGVVEDGKDLIATEIFATW